MQAAASFRVLPVAPLVDNTSGGHEGSRRVKSGFTRRDPSLRQ